MEMIPVDTVITCSRKNHRIGVLYEPVKAGDPLKLSSVLFTIGQKRIQGEPFKCTICGFAYCMDGMIHTREGWLPSDPPSLEVPRKPREFDKTVRDLGQDRPEAVQARALAAHRKEKKEKRDLRGNRGNG